MIVSPLEGWLLQREHLQHGKTPPYQISLEPSQLRSLALTCMQTESSPYQCSKAHYVWISSAAAQFPSSCSQQPQDTALHLPQPPLAIKRPLNHP